ncbi:hypothetical protein MVEN_00519200 [Mycena venus]|uniref:F-box domain-containing protein n=1 Tax=Mycena venus TaxID=2733690 RepID=A0A8H7D717_9AGAR|nr:hypothetical protein MVEN_00519200 [Mycena venus]
MATLHDMPAELCAMICDDVEPEDLLTLCFISHRFLDQSRRIIYRTADLRACSQQASRSWSLAVTRHTQLAERLHTLSLTLPSPHAATLGRALSKCVNLKELSLHHDETSALGFASQTWIIDNCPFRLTHFANSYFKNSLLSQFWDSQTEIHVLSLPAYAGETFPCSDIQLPNLIAVDVDTCALHAERPFQRIQIHLTSLDDLSPLSQYSATLTTLNLLAKPDIFNAIASLPGIVAVVGRELPALRHFGMSYPQSKYLSNTHRFILNISLAAAAGLTRLETLVLYTYSVVAFYEVNTTMTYPLKTPADLKTFGLAIMTACPLLRQVAVGAQMYNWPYRRKGPESTCTWTRTQSGIQWQNGTGFDFLVASKFWNP